MKKDFPYLFQLICFIVGLIAIGVILHIEFLPFGFVILLFCIYSILLFFSFFIQKKRVLGTIFGCLLLLFSGILFYSVSEADSIFSKIFSGKSTEMIQYYIISSKENSSEDLEGNILYSDKLVGKKSIIHLLKDNYDFTFQENSSLSDMIQMVSDGEERYLLMDSTSFHVLERFDSRVENLTVLKSFSITEEKKTKKSQEEIIHIYVVGKDFAGLNDYNMILSINRAKKKILLTSIPRDYHIPVSGYSDMEDNLTYLSALGMDTSIYSLEDFFDISISYYVKVDTSSLVSLVDELGGIEFCSDEEFTTTHALVINTYHDVGEKYHVQKGCQKVNGIEALTIARERVHINGGDVARQENCRKILLSIFDKMKEKKNIRDYQKLLEQFNGSYETNLPKSLMEEMIRKTLISDSKWEILENTVWGEGRNGLVHLNTYPDFIMIPNMDSVEDAKVKMKTLGKENLKK